MYVADHFVLDAELRIDGFRELLPIPFSVSRDNPASLGLDLTIRKLESLLNWQKRVIPILRRHLDLLFRCRESGARCVLHVETSAVLMITPAVFKVELLKLLTEMDCALEHEVMLSGDLKHQKLARTSESMTKAAALKERKNAAPQKPASSSPSAISFRCPKPFHSVFQFKITLCDIQPEIWRRIQVPETYTFWDLHCAITDAFGWLDYHLHEFTIAKPPRYRQSASTETVKIGIPGDEDWEKDVLPGRKTKIATYFSPPNLTAEYVYDFGDSWNHTVTLEGVQLKENGAAYPGCVGGERACPPEDCGGVPGYQRFLKAISFQNAKDHDELLQWAGGWFDPEWFDLSLIRFADPDLLWKIAFQDAPMSSIIRQTQYHRMKDGRRPA